MIPVISDSLHHHHTGDDPSAELNKFKLKVSFMSVIVLHEDPPNTLQDGGEPASTASDKLKEMSEKFFGLAQGIATITGVSTAAGLAQLRVEYSKACPFDHLGYVMYQMFLTVSRIPCLYFF